MAKLPDGTIIPSFLEADFSGAMSKNGYAGSTNDTTLRVGRVLAAYEVSGKGNRNKKTLEYDVAVRHANKDSGYTDIVYPRVKMGNLFGGTTDFFRWTPRIDNFDERTQIGNGSRVLLLCINGNQRLAYIIGGIPHPEDATPVLPFSEHHLEFQFNGVYANIDKDGTFTFIHRGATNAKNEVTDATGGGASIRFDKDGDVEIGFRWDIPKDSTGVKENGSDHPHIRVIKGNEGVEFYAPGSILSTTKQRFIVSTTDGVKVNPNGDDQQAWLRSTYYREEEEKMNQKLQSAYAQVSAYVQQASTSINLAGVKGQIASKLMIIPIAGSVASAVPWTAAALAFTEAAMSLNMAKSALDDIKDAISFFEQRSIQFLSQKHFHSESE